MSERKRFSELFNEAITIFRSNIKVFLLLTLFVFIPLSLANVYIAGNILDEELISRYLSDFESYVNTTDYEKMADISALTKQMSTYFFVTMVFSLFSLVADIVVIKITYERKNEIHRSFFEIFEDSVKQFPKVLGLFVITRIIISMGLLLIFPGLYLLFLFGFVTQVAVIYNMGGFRAIRHATRVSRLDLLRVVGYKLFPALLLVPITFFSSIFFEFISSKYVMDIFNIIKLSLDSLILSFGTILVTLLFFDMQKYVGEPVEVTTNKDYSTGQS